MHQKVNIGIDEKVHTKAKVIAILKGMTLNDYFEQALRRSVDKDKRLLKPHGITARS